MGRRLREEGGRGLRGVSRIGRLNASIGESSWFCLYSAYPLAFHAWAELGLSVRARSIRCAAVAYSPAKLTKVMAAIQRVSGSSLPHWIACLAILTLSSMSASDTPQPYAPC